MTKKLDLEKLSNLNFQTVDYQKFPLVKIISKLADKDSLFETVIVATNDELVKQYLNKKITFIELIYKINKFINLKEFVKYKFIKPNKIKTIENLNRYVRFKIRKLSV